MTTLPADSSNTLTVNSVCDYRTGISTDVTAAQTCVIDGLDTAKVVYDGEHGNVSAGETQEDISGIGDAAFIRYDDPGGTAALHARQGSLLVFGRSYKITDHAVAKQKLTVLVQKLFTLQ